MRELFSDSKIQTTCLVVLTISVVTYLIYWLRPVLVPFVVSLVVVSGVSPILEGLERRLRVHRLVAAAITFVLGLVGMALLGLALWASVMQLAREGRAYRHQVIELTSKLQSILGPMPLGKSVEPKGAPVVAAGEEAMDGVADDAVENPSELVLNGQEIQFQRLLDSLLRTWIGQLSAELFSLISTGVVVLIYVFFILLGSVDGTRSSGSLGAINKQVRDYLLLKTVISVATGVAYGAVLWILGVPMALTFGVLAFLLNYIPNIGPVVASLLPIPLILLQPEGSWLWMLTAIALSMAVQVISGSFVEPKMMGKSSDLHPVTILLALMFWGMLWGITGMFLATPITAGIKIALEAIPGGRQFADVMAGRWQNRKLADADSSFA